MDGTKRLVQEMIASLTAWEIWIPVDQKANLDSRRKGLKKLTNRLKARRAEFLIVQRTAEEESRGRVLEKHELTLQPAQQPILKIKPTSLPKFSGLERNYYRWRRDWESLQKQG